MHRNQSNPLIAINTEYESQYSSKLQHKNTLNTLFVMYMHILYDSRFSAPHVCVLLMLNIAYNLFFYIAIIFCIIFMFFGLTNADQLLIGIAVLFAIVAILIFLNSK